MRGDVSMGESGRLIESTSNSWRGKRLSRTRKSLLALVALLLTPLAVITGPTAPANAATSCSSIYTYAYSRSSTDITIKVYYLPGSTSEWRYCAVAVLDRPYSYEQIKMYAYNPTTHRTITPAEDGWDRGFAYDNNQYSVGPVYWNVTYPGYCLHAYSEVHTADGKVYDTLDTTIKCNNY